MTTRNKNKASKILSPTHGVKEKDYSFSFIRLSLLLVALVFCVYANTINNDYAYDDISAIRENTIVTKGIRAIPEIFSTPYRHGFFITSNDMYRPLSLVMFATEYQLFDGKPSAMHLINILFFAGCVILLFHFFILLLGEHKTTIAFIAALLFALHPIHTEVVANIKSRDELMCFFFMFLSLNLFTRYANSGRALFYVTGILCFLCSLFSKETAIIYTAIVVLVFFFYKKEHKKRSIYITLASILATVFFILLRYSVLKAYNADHVFDIDFMDNPLSGAPSHASAIATAIFILGKYLMLLLIPYPLICNYSFNAIQFLHFSDIRVLLSCAIYLFLIGFGCYRLLRFPKDSIAFSILFFLMSIFIFSNIFILTGAMMAERFLFFASAGFCLLLAIIIGKIFRVDSDVLLFFRNTAILGFLIPLSIIYSVIVVGRNAEWHDSLTLYRADVKKAPQNARLHYFAGNELLISSKEMSEIERKPVIDEASTYLAQAIEIYPLYSEAHKLLGNSYFLLAQLDSAARHLELAARLKPNDLEALNNLNVVYFSSNDFTGAIAVCKQIIEKERDNYEVYNDIAVCYMHLSKYDSAIHYLNKIINIAPEYYHSYENLALAYKLGNKKDSALKYEAIAQRNNPKFKVF